MGLAIFLFCLKPAIFEGLNRRARHLIGPTDCPCMFYQSTYVRRYVFIRTHVTWRTARPATLRIEMNFSKVKPGGEHETSRQKKTFPACHRKIESIFFSSYSVRSFFLSLSQGAGYRSKKAKLTEMAAAWSCYLVGSASFFSLPFILDWFLSQSVKQSEVVSSLTCEESPMMFGFLTKHFQILLPIVKFLRYSKTPIEYWASRITKWSVGWRSLRTIHQGHENWKYINWQKTKCLLSSFCARIFSSPFSSSFFPSKLRQARKKKYIIQMGICCKYWLPLFLFFCLSALFALLNIFW